MVCASAKDRANLAKIVARAVAVASKPKGRKRFKVRHQCGLLLPGLIVLTKSADIMLVAQAELTEVRVVGLPNAGKSSLINALRGAAVTARHVIIEMTCCCRELTQRQGGQCTSWGEPRHYQACAGVHAEDCGIRRWRSDHDRHTGSDGAKDRRQFDWSAARDCRWIGLL